jgi:hypothetical protein
MITIEDCSPCADLYMFGVDSMDHKLDDTVGKIAALIKKASKQEEPEPSLPSFPDNDRS